MQALFHFGLFPHATLFIEAYGLAAASLGLVAILDASVALSDAIWLAQGAFHIHAGHAWLHLASNDRATPFVAGHSVAAAIVALSNHYNRILGRTPACCLGYGEWCHPFRTWRWVTGVLQGKRLIGRAALAGERRVACTVNAAVDRCSGCRCIAYQ